MCKGARSELHPDTVRSLSRRRNIVEQENVGRTLEIAPDCSVVGVCSMPRKPSNPFAAKPPRKARDPFALPKAKPAPKPRKPELERLLCEAITKKLMVELRYDDDVAPREFAADVVYPSSPGKISVAGRLPKINGEWEPRIFEIGKIKSLTITERQFKPDPRFKLNDPKYRDRICPR